MQSIDNLMQLMISEQQVLLLLSFELFKSLTFQDQRKYLDNFLKFIVKAEDMYGMRLGFWEVNTIKYQDTTISIRLIEPLNRIYCIFLDLISDLDASTQNITVNNFNIDFPNFLFNKSEYDMDIPLGYIEFINAINPHFNG